MLNQALLPIIEDDANFKEAAPLHGDCQKMQGNGGPGEGDTLYHLQDAGLQAQTSFFRGASSPRKSESRGGGGRFSRRCERAGEQGAAIPSRERSIPREPGNKDTEPVVVAHECLPTRKQICKKCVDKSACMSGCSPSTIRSRTSWKARAFTSILFSACRAIIFRIPDAQVLKQFISRRRSHKYLEGDNRRPVGVRQHKVLSDFLADPHPSAVPDTPQYTLEQNQLKLWRN